MAFAASNTHFGHSLTARIQSLLKSFIEARKQRADYARTVAELEVLSDRDLLDLGLSRYEIHSTAEKHVYGRSS